MTELIGRPVLLDVTTEDGSRTRWLGRLDRVEGQHLALSHLVPVPDDGGPVPVWAPEA
jgi:hypothetical protein